MSEPAPQAAAVNDCEHHFISEHVPDHLIYWVRQCSLCHEVDWDDLDREIRGLLPPPEFVYD